MKQFKKIDNPYLIIRKCISILNLKKEEKTQILSKQRQTKLILKGII